MKKALTFFILLVAVGSAGRALADYTIVGTNTARISSSQVLFTSTCSGNGTYIDGDFSAATRTGGAGYVTDHAMVHFPLDSVSSTILTAQIETSGLAPDGYGDGDGYSISFTSATPDDYSSLVNSDYSKVGATPLTVSFPISSFVSDGVNTFDLNDAGIAYLNANAGGSVEFALRTSADIACTPAPTGYNVVGAGTVKLLLTFSGGPPGPSPSSTGSSLFSFPSSIAPSLTASASNTISDPGLLLVVVLAAGIPLTFYLIHALIGLLPKVRTRRS